MAQNISEDIKDLIYQTWLPAIMTKVFETVKKLPVEHRKAIITRICLTCQDMALAGALEIRPGMSWDEYVKVLKEASPPIGPWILKQRANFFDLTYNAMIGEDGKPICNCPFVLLGIREPLPECCDSGACLAGKMIAAATHKPVAKTEVIDSPLRTGAPFCHYRVRVKQ